MRLGFLTSRRETPLAGATGQPGGLARAAARRADLRLVGPVLATASVVSGIAALWPIVGSVLLAGILALLLEMLAPGSLILGMVLGFAIKARDFAVMPQVLTGLPISAAELALGVTLAAHGGLLVRILRQGPARASVPGGGFLAALTASFIVAAALGLSFSVVETLRLAIVVYYSAFYLLVLAIFRTGRRVRLAGYVLLTGLTVLAGLRVLAELPSTPSLLHPGEQAHLYFPIGLFLAISWLTEASAGAGKLHRLGLLAVALISAASILLTDTRAMWVAVPASLLAGLFVMRDRQRRQRLLVVAGLTLVVASFGAILVAAAYPAWFGQFSALLASIDPNATQDIALGKGYNSATRLQLWRAIIQETSGHPWFGIGLATPYRFEGLDPGYDPVLWWGPARLDYVNPHNTYLHILLRVGALGLISYVGVWCSIVVYVGKRLRSTTEPVLAAMATGGVLSIVYLLVLGALHPALETPHLGALIWVLAGLSVAATRAGSAERFGGPKKTQESGHAGLLRGDAITER